MNSFLPFPFLFCSGPELRVSYANLCETFGPTEPGDLQQTEDGKLVYQLNYPGMSLLFDIPSELSALCSQEADGLISSVFLLKK